MVKKKKGEVAKDAIIRPFLVRCRTTYDIRNTQYEIGFVVVSFRQKGIAPAFLKVSPVAAFDTPK